MPQNFRDLCTKIICVGRNYVAHAKELGNEPPSTPIIFLKPPSSFAGDGDAIHIPHGCQNLHHEIELGVVIARSNHAKEIAKQDAMDYVSGYAVCLDMTARDLQEDAKRKRLPWAVSKGFDTAAPVSTCRSLAATKDAKRKRLPWAVSKGFDTAAPVSTFIEKGKIKDYRRIHLRLTVNNQVRQQTQCDLMIFDVPTVINYISKYFTLNRGDVIMTGTPQGVGQVVQGDTLISELWVEDEKKGNEW
eukprot:CAMPEP_0197081210 /NCGR_PEP_ID=MMETSP1384-20130603/214522_1 /TAXON_ID=29189 /ORGANISM="Ammonia sp." /LENGTH=245 /DNA_ID=CAMNT_0042520105 /DNA_START=34 /DNA_END=768 /DNA_ORIENTATION=+